MCLPSRKPAPPPQPTPTPTAPPPVIEKTQASARPAGFSAEAEGRSLNKASSYDRKRTGSSKLRIPIIGGI